MIPSPSSPAKRLCIGVVTAPHGIRGAVRIKSFTAEPEAIAAYGAVTDETGARRMEIAVTGINKGAVLAQIKGVDDRNAAETLKGLRLYVDRAQLPPAEEEEFYHADLVGLSAELDSGQVLGLVSAVHDFGAGTSLEVTAANGTVTMVPFLKAVVPTIDLTSGRLIVIPPPGLLEKPEPPQALDTYDDTPVTEVSVP